MVYGFKSWLLQTGPLSLYPETHRPSIYLDCSVKILCQNGKLRRYSYDFSGIWCVRFTVGLQGLAVRLTGWSLQQRES
jgi:hypothetical protein